MHRQHRVREGRDCQWMLRDRRRRGERSQLHPLAIDLYFRRWQTYAILSPHRLSFSKINSLNKILQ